MHSKGGPHTLSSVPVSLAFVVDEWGIFFRAEMYGIWKDAKRDGCDMEEGSLHHLAPEVSPHSATPLFCLSLCNIIFWAAPFFKLVFFVRDCVCIRTVHTSPYGEHAIHKPLHPRYEKIMNIWKRIKFIIAITRSSNRAYSMYCLVYRPLQWICKLSDVVTACIMDRGTPYVAIRPFFYILLAGISWQTRS